MTAQIKVEAATDRLTTSEVNDHVSESHAFTWNAISVCEAIEASAEAIEKASVEWHIEAIRSRGRHIASLTRVACDQMRRAIDHLQPVLDDLLSAEGAA